MNHLQVKVCGIKDSENLSKILSFNPDFLGFIFVSKSPRYVVGELEPSQIISAGTKTKTVGVFMDHTISEVVSTINLYKLHFVQLHGQESSEYIKLLKKEVPDINIIKTLPIDRSSFQINPDSYGREVDLFLLDTASQMGGGAGISFDWRVLPDLNIKQPFLLAGGIGPGDAAPLRMLVGRVKNLLGVDINSRFEISPGSKDSNKVQQFIGDIRR